MEEINEDLIMMLNHAHGSNGSEVFKARQQSAGSVSSFQAEKAVSILYFDS